MLPLILLAACPEPEPLWHFTCGDPACSGYSGPFDGISPCTNAAEFEPCTVEGTTCDPVDDCNALLVCAVEDPKDQTGGCPISRAAYKRTIRYLSPEEAAEAARVAQNLRLATWNYNWEAEGTPTHLGFVIDDAPHTPAVTADGNHVDLYGYTSMTLAATQTQARLLAALEQRLATQEARIVDQERRLQEQELVIRALQVQSDALRPNRRNR